MFLLSRFEFHDGNFAADNGNEVSRNFYKFSLSPPLIPSFSKQLFFKESEFRACWSIVVCILYKYLFSNIGNVVLGPSWNLVVEVHLIAVRTLG